MKQQTVIEQNKESDKKYSGEIMKQQIVIKQNKESDKEYSGNCFLF